MNDTDLLVPLALVAAEGHGSVDQLAHLFGAEVVVDDAGIRHVPRAAARRLYDQRETLRERNRAAVAATPDRIHATLAARRERQRQILAADPDLDAWSVMHLADGDHNRALDVAGRRHDERVQAERLGLAGFGRFGRIRHTEEG